MALVVGTLLLIGANPSDADPAAGEGVVATTVLVNLGFALVGALRLARPPSPWARRRYPAGSHRLERSEQRFPAGRRTRWDGLVDWFTVVPHRSRPGAVVGSPHAGTEEAPATG